MPRRWLCLHASPLGSEAPLAFQLPFVQAGAAFTDRPNAVMTCRADDIDHIDPSASSGAGETTELYWIFLVGEPPFCPLKRVAHAIVPAYAGRCGILFREHFTEDMRLRVETRDTALTAYVLLDRQHAIRCHDLLRGIDLSRRPAIAVSCPAESFPFPPSRHIPEGADFAPFDRFVEAAEMSFRLL